jgi:aldehyde dehydrogenase (NAD+)
MFLHPTPTIEARTLIGGRLVEPDGSRLYDNVDPATEEPIGVVSDTSAEQVDEAICAARRSFDESIWSTDPSFRYRCLLQLHTALSCAREELRNTLIAETGCPVSITRTQQIDPAIDDVYRKQLGFITSYEYDKDMGTRLDQFGRTSRRFVTREPFGVVAVITPYNYPLLVNLQKLAPILGAGNTVVLKPSPDTPYSATLLGRLIAEETDIPDGVVNIVTPLDVAVAQALATDNRVDVVHFTGSVANGSRIAAVAATTVKKVLLELGGKSAQIVLDDADFDAVLPTAPLGVCNHAGQGCSTYTRLLLPRSRYDEGLEIVHRAMAGSKVGDPWDPSVAQGPVINERSRQRIVGYIQAGLEDGCRLVMGGNAMDRPGFYIEPTLFADVDPDARIAREEIFGPVFCVIPYEDEADAIRIANDSPYGLSAAVNSGSLDRAMSVARRLRVGTVSVNSGNWQGADVPFGGYKQSGSGRECGIAGFEEVLETKTVAIPA